MILYRAMCDEELKGVSENWPLNWNSKFKWFGTEEFVKTRVRNGQFNNSKFSPNRYKNIVSYEIEDGFEHFVCCGQDEFMLPVKKASLVKIRLKDVYIA